MQQVPPIHCTSSGLPQGAAATESPDSWFALLPASLLATRIHISLEGTRFSLSCIPSLLPPRPPNHTGPSPGSLRQSRLHTPSLVPEGPHGDAVFPHEAPHSTTITLHAWISEVQWLGGPCHCPGPWFSSQSGDGSCLGLSQVTSFFMTMKDKKSKDRERARP